MKLNRHNQDFLARRADQARLAKQSAAERFRNYHVDLALKKLLNRYDEKTQTICNPPTGDSIPKTSGAVAE